MRKPVISLTSIPPRFGLLGPTLASLCAQSIAIDRIILWLPRHYGWRGFSASDLPSVPAGVEIRHAQDLGPATKLLPALADAPSEDTLIIYCDDDKIYEPQWAAGLAAAAEAVPQRAVAWAGCRVGEITRRHLGRDGAMAMMTRWSGGLLQPLKWQRPRAGAIDIAFGYSGVAVRPRFFRPAVFDVPADCLVDDVWHSGQLALAGTALCKLPGRPPLRNCRNAELHALKHHGAGGQDRAAADFLAMRYMQRHYGVWPEA